MTRTEIIFLGTTASIPTSSRNHPAIYLKYIGKEEDCALFDCGESTQRQIFRACLNFMRINHIFITHWHADHFAGLFGILETMSLEKRKRPLYIYGPEASRFVGILLSLGYASKNFQVIPKNVRYDGHEQEKLLDEKEYSIFAIPVRHGVPAVAYCFKEKDRIKIDSKKAAGIGLPKQGPVFNRLKEDGEAVYKGKKIRLEDVSTIQKGKKIVYSGDSQPCKNLISISKDADMLVIDCTYFEDVAERHHMNLVQALEIADAAEVREAVLTHISRRYQSQAELENNVRDAIKNFHTKNVKVAKDFLKLVLE